MRQLCFSVPIEYNGRRLKDFLRRSCGVSARMLIRLKQTPGGLCVNGLPAIAVTVLSTGDTVCMTFPQDVKFALPSHTLISVMYEDADLLVAEKPAGMAMYPVPGSDTGTLANALAFYWEEKGEAFQFRPVYRLDKNTSGLVVVAKNSYVAAALSGKIQKEYTAICQGLLTGNGTINTPITLEPGSRIKRIASEQGVPATTHWRSMQCIKDHTLLHIQLETGRTHQIRVHMASIGHPLAGDDLYGGLTDKILRQALHCSAISLQHPVTKQLIMMNSPLPKDFVPLLTLMSV